MTCEPIDTLAGPVAVSTRHHDFPVSPRISVSKSDSNASVDRRSLRSHISVPVTGAFPYGSLRIHQPEEPPISQDAAIMKPLPTPPSSENPAEAMAGDVVLMLDLPNVFTIGYDSVSFNTRNFHGVKEILPGAHFFWASPTDSGTLRTGFWIISSDKETIHVMQWDKFNEVLGEPASQTEARIQKTNIASVYSKLTSYQSPDANNPSALSDGIAELAGDGLWRKLTSCVGEGMLNRITARNAGPWPSHTTDRVKGAVVLPSELELDKRFTSVVAVAELNFSFSQTSKTYNADSTGAARTEQAVDATSYILSVVESPDSPVSEEDVVGELQFAFVVGMHLGNESCVQQWWHMVLRIVFRAFLLPIKRPRLAALLIETITAQLNYNEKYLDGSILDYGPDNARELRLALIVYKRRLNELLLSLNSKATEDQAAVGDAFSSLEALVWKFGWDIRSDYLRSGKTMLEDGEEVEVELTELEAEDERGEFAAVVVELDDHGRQKDLISWD